MSSDPHLSVWQGQLIRLRAIEPTDWETYFTWDRDDEQARALYFVPFPQSREAVRRWAEREATQSTEGDNFRFAIARLADDKEATMTSSSTDSP
jgi:RimJ/RimL family protein N-acetyltransferase